MAVASSFIFVLLAFESYAVTAPSSQCAYLYSFFGEPLLPSLVPSISSSCLARYNADRSAVCTVECQSLYATYSQCFSPASADSYASATCGKIANSSCTDLNQQSITSGLYYDLIAQCANATYCSPSCVSAIAALERFGGCCSSDDLNGPKALCGQPPIAPCSTVLNKNSVTTPTRECAYIKTYLGKGMSQDPSLTPSLNAVCRSAVANYGRGSNYTCIAECKSLYTLMGTCFDYEIATFYSSRACGVYGFSPNCQPLKNYTRSSNCSGGLNSTYCPPGCGNYISDIEQYAGCCYASILNGYKVVCGQPPIAVCSTVLNSGCLEKSRNEALLFAVFAAFVPFLLYVL